MTDKHHFRTGYGCNIAVKRAPEHLGSDGVLVLFSMDPDYERSPEGMETWDKDLRWTEVYLSPLDMSRLRRALYTIPEPDPTENEGTEDAHED